MRIIAVYYIFNKFLWISVHFCICTKNAQMKINRILTIISFLFVHQANAQVEMHITEVFTYSTIRLVAKNTKFTNTGTGFFFDFVDPKNPQKYETVIITNKHVVNKYNTLDLYFKREILKKPRNGPAYIVTIPINPSTIIQHPNKDIDLVAIPINSILKDLEKKLIGVFKMSCDEGAIFPDSILKSELKPIENVWMIGYPLGLYDAVNNLPLVRQGITATPSYIDYNGKKMFVVDIAAFPGSSGSPVIIYRDLYVDKDYRAKIRNRIYFVGVLYAGPEYAADGKLIVSTPKPKLRKDTTEVRTNIPINLGYVIKGSEILAFKKILFP